MCHRMSKMASVQACLFAERGHIPLWHSAILVFRPSPNTYFLLYRTTFSHLLGQENWGKVGAPRSPPCIVHDLNHHDVSTGDDNKCNNNINDGNNNFYEGREIQCAVNVGITGAWAADTGPGEPSCRSYPSTM